MLYVNRWMVPVVGVVLGLALAGCASPERPKPAPLAPNVPLIGVKAAWTNTLGAVGFPLELRVVGDTVFAAASDGTVAAINAATGADLWRVRLNSALSAGVGSDGRYAAVVSKENDLIVVEAGKTVWRQRLGAATLTSPLVAGARVFVLSADRSVAAFDAATGRRLWQQSRSGEALVLGQAGLLTAVGDTLVVGLGGRLVGMNPQNGTSRWETLVAIGRGTNEVERLADLVAGFSRVGNQLCLRAFQHAIGCVDAASGRTQWAKTANGGAGVAGDASAVFSAEGDGRILALSRKDGERLWLSERLRFRYLSTPLSLGRSVVFGDDAGNLHFLSKEDGSPLDRVATDESGIAVAPVLVGQTLLVVTRKGVVRAFRPD
jgi:outer membrane assembly lipoprotein YfgL